MEFDYQSKEFEPNCAGYALHQLGITGSELYVDPESINWTDYFSKVDDPKEADAVIVTYTKGLEPEHLEHIAVFDSEDKTVIRHRRSYGTKVTPDTLKGLQERFSNPMFEIYFVKLIT
ncbi:MAG TPA: hypothetical protein VMR19_01625 [Candidatus Saccharimonadales bacterium]|jgi:hypothetical protein|nr:hypothetical protein [Candidatus Saccharimonadales bacterium]